MNCWADHNTRYGVGIGLACIYLGRDFRECVVTHPLKTWICYLWNKLIYEIEGSAEVWVRERIYEFFLKKRKNVYMISVGMNFINPV